MERKIFIEKLFARAAEEGMEKCEVSYSGGSSFSVSVFKGEVLEYSASDSLSLMFRALIDGKYGYASTQALDDDAIELLVNSARTNAELIENEDEQFMHDGSGEYAKIDVYRPEIDAVPEKDKIAFARDMEKRTLAADSRIDQVEGCEMFSETEEFGIVNTLGLDVSHKANIIGGYIAPVARDGEKVSSGLGIFIGDGADFSESDKAISDAVKQAVDYLDAGTLDSGDYRAVFRYDAMRSLLSTFSGVFSADAAQKGLSLLKGREGEKIAADIVTLTDDPLMAGSASSVPFDGEGVPTYRKDIIKDGVLTTLMHNLKTAKKQGVKTTGNASRGGSGISPANFYIAKGGVSFDEMLEKLDNGVVICDLQGLHAGANAISGDFSLSAKGYRVENGKIVEAVRQITVAGNFYQLLKDIALVADDLTFGMPGAARFGCPSVMVEHLSIAGK